jgi:PAS domain S-box-containing protein
LLSTLRQSGFSILRVVFVMHSTNPKGAGEANMDDPDVYVLLQQFVDVLPDYAISLLDADGKVLTWNAGAHAIMGYTAEEAIGRDFSAFYLKDDIAAGVPAAALADARALGRKSETGWRVRKDGTELMVENVLMPVYGPEKKLTGFGSLTRDLTSTALPAAARAPVAAEAAQILVVDDNDEVRQVAVNQLTKLGYRVIAVPNGTEALEVLGEGADVDLLFTDVVMPGDINGRELADEARRQRPGLKVLFASGYFEGALVRRGEIEQNVQFIVKPYRKKELAEKVEAVLRGTVS